MNPNNLTNKEVLETKISEIEATQGPIESFGKPKTGKGWKIATIFMTLLAIAGIAFGIFELLDANKKSDELSQCNQTDNCLDAAVADATDAEVRSLVEEINVEVEKALSRGFYKIWSQEYGPRFKEEDMKAYTSLSKMYGLAFGSLDNIPLETGDVIGSELTKRGFEKQAELMFGQNLYVNDKSGIVCEADSSSSPFICGHTSWFDGDVDLNNELAEAFYQKEGHYPEYIKAAEILDSSVAPYQKMHATVENAAGLFYRVDEDSDWQFFIGTQAALSCSDFDAEDVKNAFAGDVCYDEATGAESAVQP